MISGIIIYSFFSDIQKNYSGYPKKNLCYQKYWHMNFRYLWTYNNGQAAELMLLCNLTRADNTICVLYNTICAASRFSKPYGPKTAGPTSMKLGMGLANLAQSAEMTHFERVANYWLDSIS